MTSGSVHRPVYSYRFLEAIGVTASVGYTVPAGYVVVVRDIDVYSGGSLTQFAHYFEGSLGQTIWGYQWNSSHADSAQWRGRQVFFPTEGFAFRADQPVDVTISGYLLTQ